MLGIDVGKLLTNTTLTRVAREKAIRYARKYARTNFWTYCQLIVPNFYTEDKTYLKSFCNELQDFWYNDDDVLSVNMPPRHGKTLTLTLFAQWILGNDNTIKIMTASYSEDISTEFSKSVRNGISMEKAEGETMTVFADIFPDVRIDKTRKRAKLWALEGQRSNYLATSPNGMATGFGANLLIVDDLIKNNEEANNSTALDQHWSWFNNTMLSRKEKRQSENGQKKAKIVLVMTRWHTKDLCGRYLDFASKHSELKLKQIKYKALQDDGTMLCDSILDKREYELNIANMGEDIVKANYDQEPIDIKGRLYNEFLTYEKLPYEPNMIKAYIDTADTGSDFLCMVVYAPLNKQAYVLDVLYTKASMEVTETLVTEMLYNNKVNLANVETNSGGEGFKRNIERMLFEKYNSNYTTLVGFHQYKNKQTRILTHSAWVSKNIFFPNDWKIRWKQFATDLYEYQREGKNKHDDAPDVLTGIAEKINEVHFSFD
ncbi:phage terminase large subunit [Streptobacillus moniliformis]|uniref:phage terminase large subunit n=1 Tax=Streptobacillus moniliformis TaxID=34105 RepID=UPI0007E30268|nr:phage terminase large subunit [Streptobacillus moniliformis]